MGDFKCSVQKVSQKYRIALRLSKANSKLQFVNGYLSENAARDDLVKLLEHLRSNKRVATFEKTAEEEETYHTQKRHRPEKNPEILHVSKNVTGICLQQWRRRFNKDYWLYRSNCLKNNEALLSKADFLDKESEKFLLLKPSIEEDQCRVTEERSMKYLQKRILMLGSREAKNSLLITRLQNHVYSETCCELLRETKSGEGEEILDVTEERRFTLQTTSRAQLSRVMLQSIVVMNVLQSIQRKMSLEKSLIEANLDDIRLKRMGLKTPEFLQLMKSHDDLKASFRESQTMVLISDSVRCETGGRVSSKTIRAWYNEFLELKGFKEDLRGMWQRECFLDAYDYSLRFLMYLKNQRKLTVDRAAKDLEELIAKDPPKCAAGVEAFQSLRPFRKATVHAWMMKLGCKYEKAKISYYTDSHEAEETKRDFRER